MSYAVVLISGKQVQVSESDVIEVAKIDAKKGETLILDKVLLFNDGKKTLIGQPYIKDVQIRGEVLDQVKGLKIDVNKFKSKVRYRRKTGFRPLFTKIKIISIGSSNNGKPSSKVQKVISKPHSKKIIKRGIKKTSK